MQTLAECLQKWPTATHAQKAAYHIAVRAGELVPMGIWSRWPSHSMVEFQDALFRNAQKVIREQGLRSA